MFSSDEVSDWISFAARDWKISLHGEDGFCREDHRTYSAHNARPRMQELLGLKSVKLNFQPNSKFFAIVCAKFAGKRRTPAMEPPQDSSVRAKSFGSCPDLNSKGN